MPSRNDFSEMESAVCLDRIWKIAIKDVRIFC